MFRLRDIMTTDVLTVPPEATLREVMALFATRHVSGAPVVVANKVVGVVSTTDLMEFAASLPGVPVGHTEPDEFTDWEPPKEGMDDEDEKPEWFFSHGWGDSGGDVAEQLCETASPEWNALEQHTVADAMTRTVFSLPPGTAVEFAALRMREAGVHRVLVMQGDVLVGIVSTKDITNAVADRKLTARRFAFSPVVQVHTQA